MAVSENTEAFCNGIVVAEGTAAEFRGWLTVNMLIPRRGPSDMQIHLVFPELAYCFLEYLQARIFMRFCPLDQGTMSKLQQQIAAN